MSQIDRAQAPTIDDYVGLRSVLHGLLTQAGGCDRVTRHLLFQDVGDVMAFTRLHPDSVRKVST